MTEIPEHLLKKAKEARARLSGGGGGDDAADAAPSETAATPAVAPKATPAVAPPVEVEAAPPPPPPPHVQAALTRRRIPYWVMPILAFLPVWAYMYQGTLEPPVDNSDPLVIGQTLYEGNCASCHGATGGGGIGPAFADGDVYDTFADWRDQFRWVALGSSDWPDATYGDNAKAKAGGMPGFGESLSDAELLLVINYERSVLGGEAPVEGQDVSLELLLDLAAEDLEAGYALLSEEVALVLEALAEDPEAPRVSIRDFVIEGDGAPTAE